MKKLITGVLSTLICIWTLAGCSAVGDKSGSLSIIYGATAVLSGLLLAGCIFSVRKNRAWFITLFSSVFVVNVGYTLLSVSTCLEIALWANRISYLGSVFLPLSMLMILLDVTNTKSPKWLHGALGILSVLVFLIAASPGILEVYYKEVSFAVVNGVSTLVKVYGPLHPLYLLYLLGYFTAMVVVIFRARAKKTIETAAHAVILAIAVLVNIGVWFIEQLVSIDFEMLSVSYIISELFLLGVHLVMNENQRLREIVKQVEAAKKYPDSAATSDTIPQVPSASIASEKIVSFTTGLERLTPTEKEVYKAYIARATTKEVMAKLNITENTLKYHNRNIYSKLGVSSRKELLELHKHICSMKINETI